MVFWSSFRLARSTVQAFLITSMVLLTGPIIPYTRTILSSSVSSKQQTQIFSAFSALESIGTLLSPAFNVIYSFTVMQNYSWIVFEIMGALSGISLCLVYYASVNEEISRNLPDQSAFIKKVTTRNNSVPSTESKNRISVML
jgi:hypothetical protein